MNNRSLYTGIFAREAPAHIKKAIKIRGGVNPYGEPMYRLVRTEARKVMSGGKWTDWPKGTPLADRNPEDPKLRSLRTVVEMRPVPLYPGEATWALERWEAAPCPAEVWYLPKDQGGTMQWCGTRWMPAAGLYPDRGDYCEANFFFREGELSESLLSHIVGMIEHALVEAPRSPWQRYILAMTKAEQEQKRQDAEFDAFAENLFYEDTPLDARTPGGRAEVHRLAESVGIRSQIW